MPDPMIMHVGPNGINRKERNDCVVRAIAFATDIPYWRVADALHQVNPCHKKNTGWYSHHYQKALKILGIDYVQQYMSIWVTQEYTYYGWPSRRDRNIAITVARFTRENSEDRYLFSASNHLIGIKGGKTNHKASRHRAQRVYLLISHGGHSY